MKFRHFFLLALAATLGTAPVAAQKSKKKAKTSKVVKAATPELKPVPAAEFSYAMGVAQAPSLRQFIEQRHAIDSTMFNDFVAGLNGQFSAEDIKRMRAIVAGADIAEQNTTQILPAINKQATGKEDSGYVDARLFKQGLVDGVLSQSQLSADSASKIVERQFDFQKAELKKDQIAFLENYKKQKDVKATASGLLYKVVKQGTGEVPTESSRVEVHYEGKLIDGTVFDSSYKRNQTATFGVTQVIKGWTEALKMMPVGSEYELCIPYDLAYGEQGNRDIPPFATLIFKVELVSIK